MNDTLPSSQPGFVYMQAKASLYLKMGPVVYRRQDAMGMPPEDATPEELSIVERGMQQVLDGRGTSADTPLTGLGVHGFNWLVETLHFDSESQAIASMDDDHILDRMRLIHMVDPDITVELYNRVEQRMQSSEIQ